MENDKYPNANEPIDQADPDPAQGPDVAQEAESAPPEPATVPTAAPEPDPAAPTAAAPAVITLAEAYAGFQCDYDYCVVTLEALTDRLRAAADEKYKDAHARQSAEEEIDAIEKSIEDCRAFVERAMDRFRV